MEVAGQGEPPGDPWTNDPGPLITPVDAGTAPPARLDLNRIAVEASNGNPAIKISPWGLSRAEEQLPCVRTGLQLSKTKYVHKCYAMFCSDD